MTSARTTLYLLHFLIPLKLPLLDDGIHSYTYKSFSLERHPLFHFEQDIRKL